MIDIRLATRTAHDHGGTCTEHPGRIALQEALGFRRVGLLHEVGFKFGRWLDVVYLQLILSPGEG